MSKESIGVVLGVFDLLTTISLYLMEKSGKTNVIVTSVLLIAMTALSLSTIYTLVPWLWDENWAERIWRVFLATAIILLAVGRFGIWVWPSNPPPIENKVSPQNSANYPDIEVLQSRYCRLSEFFPSFGSETLMMVLPLRNKSTVGWNVLVSAHISYRDSAGEEKADIERGSWFPTPVRISPHTTTFPTLKTRNLAVFFLQEGELFKPTIRWLYQTGSGYSLRMPEPKHDKFPEKITIVKVTLLTESEPPKSLAFKLVDHGKNSPTLEQIS